MGSYFLKSAWVILNVMWLVLIMIFSATFIESDIFDIIAPFVGQVGLLMISILFLSCYACITRSKLFISIVTTIIMSISIIQGVITLVLWITLHSMDYKRFIWPGCRVLHTIYALPNNLKIHCLCAYVGYYQGNIFPISGLIFILGMAHYCLSRKLRNLQPNTDTHNSIYH